MAAIAAGLFYQSLIFHLLKSVIMEITIKFEIPDIMAKDFAGAINDFGFGVTGKKLKVTDIPKIRVDSDAKETVLLSCIAEAVRQVRQDAIILKSLKN